jgi:hypothetical protein
MRATFDFRYSIFDFAVARMAASYKKPQVIGNE